MGKLFGTDGIRGVVNAGLDAQLAYQVGLAAAAVLRKEKGGERPVVTIGKDTRISSDVLEGALVAGLCSAGADVLHLGVFPTPAVAFATVDKAADAGVVISASHNPFEHNGIKIFNGRGVKLSDALENEIEDIILNGVEVPVMTHGDIGRVTYLDAKERERYLDHLVSTIDSDLAGLRIAVDCANGAASATAPALFARFPKLDCDIFYAEPDGVNINNGCGSTHLEALRERMKTGRYDLGLAFDGDADRFLAVDELGEPIDGDQIMAICGSDLMARGELPGNRHVQSGLSAVHERARHEAGDHRCGRPQCAGADAGEGLCPGWRAVGPHHLFEARHHRRRAALRPSATTGAEEVGQTGLGAGGHVRGLSPDAHQCPGGRQGRQRADHGFRRSGKSGGRDGAEPRRQGPGAGASLRHRGAGAGDGRGR